MLNNIIKLNNLDLKFFIFLGLFWVSINTGSKYILYDVQNSLSLNYFINSVRSITPYLILFFFIFNFKTYLSKKILAFDLIFFCFLIFGILQLFGLFFSSQNMHEHYWVICLFSLLIFYKNLLEKKNDDLIKFIFITNILFILIIFIFFVFIALKENILSFKLLYHSSTFIGQLGGEYMPRSSGISRMGLILFIFFNSIYFSKKTKKNNFYYLIINSLIISLLLILQSRAVILFFFILFLFINFTFNFENFKNRIIYFTSIIIIPFILFFSYPILKQYTIQKLEIEEKIIDLYNDQHENKIDQNKNKLIKDNFIRKDFLSEKKGQSFREKITNFSNNRVYAWDFLIQVFLNNELKSEMEDVIDSKHFIFSKNEFKGNQRYFFGLGPQADRYLLNLKKTKQTGFSPLVVGPFGAHASNVFVYSFVCAGFIGIGIFLLINLFLLSKILLVLKNKSALQLKHNYLLSSSIMIILFLQFRGIFENSYGVFGVDLIFFFLAYTVIQTNLRKLND